MMSANCKPKLPCRLFVATEHTTLQPSASRGLRSQAGIQPSWLSLSFLVRCGRAAQTSNRVDELVSSLGEKPPARAPVSHQRRRGARGAALLLVEELLGRALPVHPEDVEAAAEQEDRVDAHGHVAGLERLLRAQRRLLAVARGKFLAHVVRTLPAQDCRDRRLLKGVARRGQARVRQGTSGNSRGDPPKEAILPWMGRGALDQGAGRVG